MNSVGIDVSKGKSTVCVRRVGEEVLSPFEINHTASELSELAKLLKSLDGEIRVVMEATGNYHLPIASTLHNAGIFVSVVNPVLIHGYGNNSLRPAKTDRKDAEGLADYGLQHWADLLPYTPPEDTRALLKTCYRQYQQCAKIQTMLKNNLISLLDMIFPGSNRLFTSPQRADGTEKWVDFVDKFWHCGCVSGLSENVFIARYQKWCGKHGYHFNVDKACEIHRHASACVSVFAKTDTIGGELIVQNEAEIFGAVLKAARQKAGLTVEALAERIDVTERYIYRLENNGKTPGYAVLCRLIRELAILPELLFYPEKSTQDSEVDALIRKLATCDERAIKVARATIQSLIDTAPKQDP